MAEPDNRSKTGLLLIAFLLSAESAMLWASQWRWAMAYLALHIASVVGVVGLASSGFEPLHAWGRERPEVVLYLGNALAALPAFIHASKFLDEPPGNHWFSKWYVVVAAYVAIGISIYHYAKPFLVSAG
jgi:hypothetical protein